MKLTPNTEHTFVNPENNQEFMIWVDSGSPTRIYAYADNTGLDGLYMSSWESRENKAFIYCPDDQLQDAFTIITTTCVI